jgi:hypothetical protein
MAEVQEPGAKCSTGQSRPILQDKAKEKKREYHNKVNYQGRKGERHMDQTTKRKMLEHLP